MTALVQQVQGYFHCNVCSEKFQDSNTFLGHMKNLKGKLECVGTEIENRMKGFDKFENTMDSKRKCQFCEKKFGANSHLKRHTEQVHEKKKDHMCKECHKSYFSVRDLNIHFNAVHERVKKFKCKSCEKTFSQKGNMKTHYETQHLGIRNYKCNHCDETFTQNQYLQNHLKRNHRNRTKPILIKLKKANS